MKIRLTTKKTTQQSQQHMKRLFGPQAVHLHLANVQVFLSICPKESSSSPAQTSSLRLHSLGAWLHSSAEGEKGLEKGVKRSPPDEHAFWRTSLNIPLESNVRRRIWGCWELADDKL